MPTWLVNPKMDPALAARVHASVTGRRGRAMAARSIAPTVATIRFVVLVGVAGLVVAILLQIRSDRAQLVSQRSTLLRTWSAKASPFTPKQREFLVRLERLFARYSGPYSGDLVAAELRAPGGLAAVLARPSVYVRGPIAALATSEGLARAAADSGKDSLLVCLLAPPDPRTEKALLKTARMAMSGGAPIQQLVPQVRRLLEAEVGLPFVMPAWGERIRNAKDAYALDRLELALNKAPLAAAKRVVEAELAIAAFDEPANTGAATELDGENAHSVRLVILELESGRALLVMRRQVDPTWITPNRRSLYARELDGCKLALEVRDAVQASPAASEARPTSKDPQ
ncbi:MAG: hypothetical protein JW940_06750 [Polyangiaceae bacterium]|nr:hypothetical protein [Polyangiaceae bacterium]